MSSSPNLQLAPATTAVVVIDVQIGLFDGPPPAWEKDAVLARINQVIARAREVNAAVLFLQHDGDPAGTSMRPASAGWQLHPRVNIRPEDAILHKTTCDGFYRTSLEAWLRDRGIETLVLLGYATEFCVDSTLRSAASKGFKVIAVADGHTTHDSPVLKAEKIIRHHNHTWSEMDCEMGIWLVRAGEMDFLPPQTPPRADRSTG